jgi:hypothetical protein
MAVVKWVFSEVHDRQEYEWRSTYETLEGDMGPNTTLHNHVEQDWAVEIPHVYKLKHSHDVGGYGTINHTHIREAVDILGERSTASQPVPYTFHINPNEMNGPIGEKAMNILTSSGPTGGAIIQEGKMTLPSLDFSGIILEKDHMDKMEEWFRKRVLLDLTDDLGRQFRGVFSSLSATRPYSSSNFYRHQYQASFQIWSYVNGDGTLIYGRNS